MKYFYLTLALLLSYQLSFACSCVYVPTFCETITYHSDTINSSYLIVHGRVESIDLSGMEVRIKDVLFGVADGNMAHIINGNGADCRVSVSIFNEGDEYIFALWGHSIEGYSLSECGVSWLNVDGNLVKGPVAEGITEISMEGLLGLEECGDLGSYPVSTISVRPTLTAETIQIFSSRDIEQLDFAMYDMIGREVIPYSKQKLLESAPILIPAYQYPSGCYAIVTKVAGLRKVFRVVIISEG